VQASAHELELFEFFEKIEPPCLGAASILSTILLALTDNDGAHDTCYEFFHSILEAINEALASSISQLHVAPGPDPSTCLCWRVTAILNKQMKNTSFALTKVIFLGVIYYKQKFTFK
jgi:hypothetical protein